MPFVLAFTGVRGIVSLAAALAIPFATTNGQLFPDRDLILFLTFSVILVTLVGQGLLLPSVIRALGLANADAASAAAIELRNMRRGASAIEAALERLDRLAAERGLAENVVQTLRARQRARLKHIEHRSDGDDEHKKLSELHDEIELLLIAAERQQTNDLFRGGKLKDEARRRIERELDLREAHLANQRDEE